MQRNPQHVQRKERTTLPSQPAQQATNCQATVSFPFPSQQHCDKTRPSRLRFPDVLKQQIQTIHFGKFFSFDIVPPAVLYSQHVNIVLGLVLIQQSLVHKNQEKSITLALVFIGLFDKIYILNKTNMVTYINYTSKIHRGVFSTDMAQTLLIGTAKATTKRTSLNSRIQTISISSSDACSGYCLSIHPCILLNNLGMY